VLGLLGVGFVGIGCVQSMVAGMVAGLLLGWSGCESAGSFCAGRSSVGNAVPVHSVWLADCFGRVGGSARGVDRADRLFYGLYCCLGGSWAGIVTGCFRGDDGPGPCVRCF